MPEPLGEPVLSSTLVDSDHASNFINRRSHEGILLFVCDGLIKSFDKVHNTGESSTFGSELVALHIASDIIFELSIKLKSIKVPLIGPTDFYGNNQVVLKNTSIP